MGVEINSSLLSIYAINISAKQLLVLHICHLVLLMMDHQNPSSSFFNNPTDNSFPNQSEDVQLGKQIEFTQHSRPTRIRKKSEVNQDVSQLKAIAVYGIPENINNKVELKKRFEVYGPIVRLFPNPSKGTATIHFDNHTNASQAKTSATTFADLPDADVKILWKQVPNKTKPKEGAINPSDLSTEKKTVAPVVPTRKEPTNKYSALDDSLIMRASLEELNQFIKIPAKSMSDKVALLDARDRIIRLKTEAQQKSSGSNRTKNLKGSCPDMCPEKERYSRCDKRRLAVYEMVETGGKDYEVDHRFAVKEYSRSSADQAEPLPHELRPLHVLEMAANYLFSTIVDRCDSPSENLGEWYNFLWDRTRGIRKDITQQSLCELGSVDLVEKCARLHIHCTARLCELDMQDFDQKINDENLTKCLQTLKHMYYDLSLKKVYCPNEAEFRSYDVLLHLNDGDTLRNVLQLREEIRDSPLVQTALKFFHTLNASNYVRFFKLTEENKHYLQCCLLQRYFNQIRNKALHIMIHAYGPPKKGQVPFSWVKDTLGFENAEEAFSWCDAHGLTVDEGKDLLLLERRTFIEMPQRFPPIRRSFRLIESKRCGPLSQIIANGPINADALANHRPQNSFDLNGYLKKEALFEEENIDKTPGNIQEELVVRAKNLKQPLIERLSTLVFHEIMLSETNALTTNVVHETLRQRSRNKIICVGIQRLWEGCLRDIIDESVKDYVAEHSAELQRRRKEQALEYKRLKREEFMLKMLNETLMSAVQKAVAEIVEDEIKEAIAKRKATLDRLSAAISTRLLDEVLLTEVASISNSVAREEIDKREDLVRRVSAIAQRHRLKRCFTKWVKFTKRKINLREEQRVFPACPSYLALEQQVSLLVSTGETRRSNKRKSLVDLSCNAKRISNLIDLQHQILQIDHSFEQKRVDLFALFEQLAKSNACKIPVKAWKLSIVNLNSQNASVMLQKWIGLRNRNSSANGWPSRETRMLPSGDKLSITVSFGEDYRENCDTDALLLVFEPSRDITNVLQNLSEDITSENIIGTLAIHQAENRSTYSIPPSLNSVWNAQINVEDPNSISFLRVHEVCTNVIDHSFRNLLKKKPHETTIWDLVHRFVMKHVLRMVDRDLQKRRMNGSPHAPLETLLNFYNERISKFLSVLESNEDRAFTTSNYATTIELVANYMILPNSIGNFQSLGDISSYCRQVVVSESDPSSFMSRIHDITAKYNSPSHISKIPWTDIFQACLDYRMQAFIKKGSEISVCLSMDFSECLKEAFGTTVGMGTFFTAAEEDIEEDLRIKTSPETDRKTTQQFFAREVAIPQSIQTLCEKISLASSQIVEDTLFSEKSLNLSSFPSQKSPKTLQKTDEQVTLEENLALLEERIGLARRSDHQFESLLSKACRK